MSKAIARVSIVVVVFSIIIVSLIGVYASTLLSSSPSVSSSVSTVSLTSGSHFQNSIKYYDKFYTIIFAHELTKF